MDVATFLRGFAPFDALDEERLAAVVGQVEIEHFAPGQVVLREAGEPARFLYVVRKGAVEILDDGRLIDLMGEGEVFGAWSLLGHFSPTATVRANEDTLCYLIPEEVAKGILGTSAGIALVMRNLRRRIVRIDEAWHAERPADAYRPVGTLVRRPAVVTEPATTVAEAAARMVDERVSSLLVETPDGLGIVTDRDLRSRVVAAGRDAGATRVDEVMSLPATTVPSDTPTGEVLLRMLEGGFHHLPVVDGEGRLVGVVTDTDLMGLGRHTPFAVKSAIERARTDDDVVRAAGDLPDVVATLVATNADPVEVGHVVTLTIDTLTRRLIELAIETLGTPPVAWAWIALGSAARREQALLTDQDHAFAFEPHGMSDEEIDPYFGALAERVTDGLESAGIPRCLGDVMAANPALRRSVEGWERQFEAWMSDPGPGSVFLSIVFDYRRVAGPLDIETALDAVVRTAPRRPAFVRQLGRRALDERPPTGFFRDVVVEAHGEHRGRVDVKHGGITIVSNLARAYAISAGATERRTIERLRGAAADGTIDDETAEGLEEAFGFLWGVRLRHHAERWRAGLPLDDHVDPAELGPVARHGLKEAFRVIGRAQRMLATDLGVQLR
jgi:CBS domain-containing protein